MNTTTQCPWPSMQGSPVTGRTWTCPVSAQLRALREYAKKNGYIVVREYVDEAESGRIADRPQFPQDDRRCRQAQCTVPGDPGMEVLPIHQKARARRRLQVHAQAQGGQGSSPSPSTPTTPPPASSWRPSSRAWTNSTARTWPRRSRGGCGSPPLAASGSPATPPSATTG